MRISDWSSDVCSSDLGVGLGRLGCSDDLAERCRYFELIDAQDPGALRRDILERIDAALRLGLCRNRRRTIRRCGACGRNGEGRCDKKTRLVHDNILNFVMTVAATPFRSRRRPTRQTSKLL